MSSPQKYILTRTGNCMAAGAGLSKASLLNSNVELLNSLRENYKGAIELSVGSKAAGEGNAGGSAIKQENWTATDGNVLNIPNPSVYSEKLRERVEDYDITVKLFYLPGVPPNLRCAHTREALQHVFSELGISSASLLIVAFPNIHFDADDEDDDSSPASENEGFIPEPDFLQTYRTLEDLQMEGLIGKIGLSEFGTARLEQVLKVARVKPSVDQINVRDCCVVPKPVILYAKEKGIELLTHDDCDNVLPAESLESLLGEFGIEQKTRPLWAVKYTAVVRDRGVVENKGYIAMAEVL